MVMDAERSGAYITSQTTCLFPNPLHVLYTVQSFTRTEALGVIWQPLGARFYFRKRCHNWWTLRDVFDISSGNARLEQEQTTTSFHVICQYWHTMFYDVELLIIFLHCL
jgi:hypothetical protein